jgi:outer membrane protein assembly factor BamA
VQSSGTTRKTRNTRDFEMNEGAFAEEEEENKKNGTSPAQQQQQQQQIARRFLISSYDVTGVSNDLIALAKSVMTIKPNYSYTANEVQEQVTLINQLGVFKKIEPQVTETRDGMVIDFQLESHPEIRSIVVSGCDYLPNTVLTNAFKGQMNKVLNMHKFHSGMRKIRDWYNVNAIPSNILGADVDTDTGVVELRISEPKIGNVNVRFLDAAGNPQKKGTTKPSIIARYLSNVKPGKVYSIKGVQDDLRAVYANCPVEDVSSQPIPRNAAAGVQQQQQQQAEGENLVSRDTTAKVQDSMIMDFTVNIVEKSPGGFSAGGGMSAKGLTEGNFGGLLANVNYVQRNLFGKCQKLNLGLEVVPKSNSKKGIDADIKLSLSDPWIEGDKRRTARTFNLNTAAISAGQIYGASQFQDDNDEGAEDRLSSAFNVDANSTRMNVNNNIGDIGSSTINDNKVGDNNNSVGEKTGGFSKTISQLSGGKSRDDTVAKEDSTRNDENNAAPSNNKKDSSNEVRVRKLISSIDYSRPLANGWNGTFIASWCRSSLWDGQRNSILHDAYGAPLTFSGSGCDVAATSQLRVVYSAPDGDTQLMLSAEQALPLRPDWLNFTRLFARAQRTFQFPIFSSSKGREQNLGSMMSTDRETDEIKRGAFASTPIKLTLASKGGNVIGDLPPHEAFPIGGTNSVRGYNEGAVGTARKFVVGSAELVVPTGIEHISASLFFDCGSDLNSGSSILGDPAGTRGKPGSGFGYGAGFQLASPFGPLRLEYAKNDHGITRAHFGIGRSF